jgi:hypothetical protein
MCFAPITPVGAGIPGIAKVNGVTTTQEWFTQTQP